MGVFAASKDAYLSDLLNSLFRKSKKKVVIHLNFCSLFCARFLGDRRHQRSLPVSIKDPSDLGIRFLQGRERENSPMICQEPIIPRSPVQVYTILLFKCINLPFHSFKNIIWMSKIVLMS